jgi:hypothetical protein
MRGLTRTIQVIFVALLFILWLLPSSQNTAGVTWIAIALATGCALYLSVAHRRFLRTWRGFGSVTVILFLVLTWLRWEWYLWGSDAPLLQNVNLVVSMLACALFISLYISSLLLVIYEDASLAFLGASWLMNLLLLLAIGAQYGRLGTLTATSLGEQLFWGVPLAWVTSIWCLALPAFFVHLTLLLIKELKAWKVQ